ncbi:MAG: hypothetical protein B9J98_00700 [Candidatus Terraquivivens tikiterensis]|uniref:4Fe-4S domain-containing protein n=1 Tax=Candidatus Terraquivivens tikiterensis TaxID=1980982 RepID=A0A2R7YA29_9ARCH|nr:MAG: hypothetical protein B9J98_00700 [Candidatus Terraquivivens tikiterensis]
MKAEDEALLRVAELMALSARTAPKARGLDSLSIAIVYGEEKEKLAKMMEELADELGQAFFKRDAENVRQSPVVLLLAVKATEPKRLDCSACGYRTCSDFEKAPKSMGRAYRGPTCAMYITDLGIAAGSAAKTASMLNADNRIMYTVGTAALRLGLIDGDVALGIPLSATGKSPYFDRRA